MNLKIEFVKRANCSILLRGEGISVKKFLWLTSIFAVSLLPHVSAQADTWYHVEIIAFEYFEPQHSGGERFNGEVGRIELENVLELIEDVPEFDDELVTDEETVSDDEMPMAFKALVSEELRLAPLAGRLSRSPEHRVLAHVAWLQPKFINRGARFVHIKPLSDLEHDRLIMDSLGSPVVEGVLRVRSEQQLHVDADFVYQHEQVPVRLTETRRIRLREVHYFDHPLFGLLLEIAPFVFDVPLKDLGELPVLPAKVETR